MHVQHICSAFESKTYTSSHSYGKERNFTVKIFNATVKYYLVWFVSVQTQANQLLIILTSLQQCTELFFASSLLLWLLKPKRQQESPAQELRSLVKELREVLSENHRPHTDNNGAGSGFHRRRSAPEKVHRTTLYVWLHSHTLKGLTLLLG